MGKLLFVLIVSVFVAGCGVHVRTYTFDVDRTDQKMEGNRGYITGTPPATQRDEKKTRKWVGVDVELPTQQEIIDESGLTVIGAGKRPSKKKGQRPQTAVGQDEAGAGEFIVEEVPAQPQTPSPPAQEEEEEEYK